MRIGQSQTRLISYQIRLSAAHIGINLLLNNISPCQPPPLYARCLKPYKPSSLYQKGETDAPPSCYIDISLKGTFQPARVNFYMLHTMDSSSPDGETASQQLSAASSDLPTSDLQEQTVHPLDPEEQARMMQSIVDIFQLDEDPTTENEMWEEETPENLEERSQRTESLRMALPILQKLWWYGSDEPMPTVTEKLADGSRCSKSLEVQHARLNLLSHSQMAWTYWGFRYLGILLGDYQYSRSPKELDGPHSSTNWQFVC